MALCAVALMTKMKMAAKDRPKVKLECLRLLTTLRLDPAKSKLIGGFVDGYLRLTPAETQRYAREFAKLTETEKETTMEIVTSWEKTGMERIVLHLLHNRLGDVPKTLEKRISNLSANQLESLSETIFDLKTPNDLEQWLSQHELAMR